MRRIAFAFAAFIACFCAQAVDAPKKIYAQELIDQVVPTHPKVAGIEVHVTPPKAADNIVIAAYNGRLGEKADPEDLDVIKTGKPNAGVNSAGDRYEVRGTAAPRNVTPSDAWVVPCDWRRRASRSRICLETYHDALPGCIGNGLHQVPRIQGLPRQGDHWRLQERRATVNGLEEKAVDADCSCYQRAHFRDFRS